MKKNLIGILSAIAILGLLFGVAAAPAVTRTINFLEVRFIIGKGYVFLFEATGEFKESELKGSVSIGNDSFPLDCNFRDDGTIGCMAAGNLTPYIGREMTVSLAGFVFYGITISEKLECNSIAMKLTLHSKSSGYVISSNTRYVPKNQVRAVFALVKLFNSLSSTEYITIDSVGCSDHEPKSLV